MSSSQSAGFRNLCQLAVDAVRTASIRKVHRQFGQSILQEGLPRTEYLIADKYLVQASIISIEPLLSAPPLFIQLQLILIIITLSTNGQRE